jgi:hypothetical protein
MADEDLELVADEVRAEKWTSVSARGDASLSTRAAGIGTTADGRWLNPGAWTAIAA